MHAGENGVYFLSVRFSSIRLQTPNISEAGEKLFDKLAKSRGWRNFTKERADEMKTLVRYSYRRKLLTRNGHSYTIST